MDIFGIGALELLLILLLALVILGPEQMVKVGRTLGRWMRKFNLSPTVREIRNLPYRMMREAGIDEMDLSISDEKGRKTPPPPPSTPPIKQTPNTIGIQGVIPSEWVNDPSRVETPHVEASAPSEWVTPPAGSGNGSQTPPPAPQKPRLEKGKQE